MTAPFRPVSLESQIPQESGTVSGSGNASHESDQDNIDPENSQGRPLQHMSPQKGDQPPVQEPETNQLSVSAPSRSPSPSRLSYDSLEQFSTSSDHQPEEANIVQGQKISNARSRSFTTWTLEALSCVIAFLCLGAIVGVLYAHRGLPLPQWPMKITINALIAVFTAIFKMALMVPIANGISQFKWLWFDRPHELADIERLDQASRGAWGSFLLLVSRVPRLDAIWLANLGAIITIVALAVDPFSQQIIQSEPCLQDINGGVAEIPKLQYFQESIVVTFTPPPLSGSLQAAIYMGLLSPPPNSSAAITADCRTGNCTFPSDEKDGATFSTLAMCHSCVDISDTITYDDSTYGGSRPTIPSGAYIVPDSTVFASTANSNLFEHALFSFEALISRDMDNSTDNFAVACGITACLKTFEADVTNGIYQERELSSVDLAWSDTAGYSLATNMTLRDGSWQSCTPTPQNTTANTMRINTTTMGLLSHVVDNVEYPLLSNMALEGISPGASLWYPDDCVWWFGDFPSQAISSFLEGLFANKTLEMPFWSYSPTYAWGDLWLVNLYRNGTADIDTVGAYMDGLAWSMTAAMRQTSASEDTPLWQRAASGQIQEVQYCLTVQWAWLSLPASLLGLQLAFLVAIVVVSRSAKHWRGDWKDSSLALLYHGLEGAAQMPGEKVEREKLRDKDGMFKVARTMKVQLRQGEDNWQFRTVP